MAKHCTVHLFVAFNESQLDIVKVNDVQTTQIPLWLFGIQECHHYWKVDYLHQY